MITPPIRSGEIPCPPPPSQRGRTEIFNYGTMSWESVKARKPHDDPLSRSGSPLPLNVVNLVLDDNFFLGEGDFLFPDTEAVLDLKCKHIVLIEPKDESAIDPPKIASFRDREAKRRVLEAEDCMAIGLPMDRDAADYLAEKMKLCALIVPVPVGSKRTNLQSKE